MATQTTHVAVIVRASTVDDLVHHDEIGALVRQRGGQLHEVIGSRRRVRVSPRLLRRLVPDVAGRDVYVCGPVGFTGDVIDAAQRLAVAGEQIHTETFGF